MLDSIKEQVSGVMGNTNKMTAFITIGLIVLFTVVSVWFYRKYVVPSLDEDTYLENSEYRNGGGGGDGGGGAVTIYFFHTEWCPHCKKADPIWEQFKSDLGANNGEAVYNGHPVNFVKIDCDKDKNIADEFNVTSYPTIKLVYRDKIYNYDARPDAATLM